jgi:multiple sugar transport system substrate-binding protein
LSYSWRGRQWGLAADVACQVSVFRADLLPESDVPHTWSEALALASAMHGRVTTSLASHDAICSLLTLCANSGTPITPTPERFADPDIAMPALDWMVRYTEHCHLSAWDGYVVEPMATSNEIVYGLFQWGYMDRALATAVPARLRFLDIPSGDKGPIGATLGGAGLGISSSCREPAQAAAYCAWVTGAEVQRDIVFKFGGNPGSRTVWDDERLDEQVNGFFSGTRASLQNASVRPRDEWWPQMGHLGGEALARGLRTGESPERIMATLEREYHAARAQAAH